MKVNTNTLSQSALCYHCLQRGVGGCQVSVMKWEERVHRHQQRKVHSLLPCILLSEKVAFNYVLCFLYEKAFENPSISRLNELQRLQHIQACNHLPVIHGDSLPL